MKTSVYSIDGKKEKTIELPSVFLEEVRTDILSKVIEAKKIKQPHSPAFMAGRQHSASGIINHKRHSWKSGYGKGQSRTPRKVMSNKGNQFSLVGAEVPHTRGGRRAHPPKVEKMINYKKVNRKELQKALMSAIAATAKEEFLLKRYATLRDMKMKVELPFVVDSKISGLKIKEVFSAFKKILGEELFNIAIKKKSIRSGRGKMRGRRYKKSAGVLIVAGEKENFKSKTFDVVKVGSLSVNDLAEADAPGRLTIYTENAVNDLKNKFEGIQK